ncbi:GspH/FimT family pseudopilin [Luteimonas sp. A501]
MRRNRLSGFSLIELMITIAVLAVLLAIGLPSFQGSMRSNRVATGTNELIASMSLARSEAIRSPGGAALCPSSNGTTCLPDASPWTNGWMVWVDQDGNGLPGGINDRVLRYVEGIADLDIKASSKQAILRFDQRGRAVTPVDFTVASIKCPAGHSLVRELTLTATGQVRTERSECE